MFSRHLFIKTNQSCNLHCVYCYEKRKGNEVFDEEQVFLKIVDVLRKRTPYGTKIKLIGGEPFLVFDSIRRFCERIWKEGFEEEIHFQITTNGTLVHGEIQDWLRLHRDKVECKLSLDGRKSSQDINRPNSFDRIDIPFFAQTWNNCSVNMVITPKTLCDFAANVVFLHESGLYNVVPIFAVLTDWRNSNLQKEYYHQLMHLAEYYVEHQDIKRCRTLDLHLERLLSNSDNILCDIGKKIIYDVNSEKYYPCHLFFPSVCGDRCPKNMSDLDFSKRSTYEHQPCATCPFINLCHTCYAANFIERGDLGCRDMSLCEYRKIDFLVNAKLEYNRILKAQDITDTDFLIMKAISVRQKDFELIESKYQDE